MKKKTLKPINIITLEDVDLLENEAIIEYFDETFPLTKDNFELIAKKLQENLMYSFWQDLEDAVVSVKDWYTN